MRTKSAVLIVLVVSVVLGVLFWLYGAGFLEKETAQESPVELTVWGFEDDSDALKIVLDAYQKAKPSIKINYIKQSLVNYRPRLQTQIEAGQGPDIFPLHSSWVPMLKGNLAAVPAFVTSVSDFEKAYYPLAKDSFIKDNKVYGIPVGVGGLVLFVNEDIIKSADVEAPKTWTSFLEGAKKVTVTDREGKIQTAGAALGTTTNVDFWPEIISLLFFQQPKASLSNPGTLEGAEVLEFYTGFVLNPQNKTWDTDLPPSTQMFKDGRLAFYMALAEQIEEIKRDAPNLNFAVYPVPQLQEGAKVGLGSLWGLGVAKNSTHSREAFELVRFLASKDALQFIFEQNRINGKAVKVYPRREMASLLSDDPKLAAFLTQGENLESWYLNTGVTDNGLNDGIIVAYRGMVADILQGKTPLAAAQERSKEVQEALKGY